MSRLGDLIRTERLRAKMTPKQVAKKCGVSESYIMAVEAGTRIIADDQARRILKTIGLREQTEADFSLDDIAATVDLAAAAPAVAQVLRVRGMMLEYNGRPQLRVDKMRPATDADDFDMEQLAPCAPLPPQVMKDEIFARAERFADPQLRALVLKRLEQCGEKLDYYPAASKLHHAERSGLLQKLPGPLGLGGD